jgi:hypothetical protein
VVGHSHPLPAARAADRVGLCCRRRPAHHGMLPIDSLSHAIHSRPGSPHCVVAAKGRALSPRARHRARASLNHHAVRPGRPPAPLTPSHSPLLWLWTIRNTERLFVCLFVCLFADRSTVAVALAACLAHSGRADCLACVAGYYRLQPRQPNAALPPLRAPLTARTCFRGFVCVRVRASLHARQCACRAHVLRICVLA